MKKRILSMLLALCMALTLLPTVALADSSETHSETHADLTGLMTAEQTMGKADLDYAAEITSFDQLVKFVKENGNGNVKYSGSKELVISKDISLPGTMRLYATEAQVTVASGVTLDNAAMIICRSFYLAAGAKLNNDRRVQVSDGMTLAGDAVNDSQLILDGGALVVTGSLKNNRQIYMQHGSFEGNELQGVDKITHGRDGCIHWEYDAHTGERLKKAMDIIGRNPRAHEQYGIYIYQDVTAIADIYVNEQAYLWVQDSASLTVPAGLTYTNKGELFVKGTVNMNGTLDNQGRFSVNAWEDAGSYGCVSLGASGVYTGQGEFVIEAGEGAISSPKELLPGFDMGDFTVEVEHRDSMDMWKLTLKGSQTGGGSTVVVGQEAPTNLRAEFNAEEKCVDLRWDEVDGVSRYAVYRSVNGSDFQWLVSRYVNNYYDEDVTEGNTYAYQVCCYKPTGGVGTKTQAVEVKVVAAEEKGYTLTMKYDDDLCDFTVEDQTTGKYVANGGTVVIDDGGTFGRCVFRITNIASGYRIKDFLVNGVSNKDGMIDGSYGFLSMGIRQDSEVEVVLEKVPAKLPAIKSAVLYEGRYNYSGNTVAKDIDFGENLDGVRAGVIFDDGQTYPDYFAKISWEYSTDNGVTWKEVPSWGTHDNFWAAWSCFTDPEWVNPPIDFMTLKDYFLRARLEPKKDYSTVNGGQYAYSTVVSVNFDGEPPVIGGEEDEPVELVVPAKPYDIKNVVSGVHVYWKATEGADKYGLWRSENGKDGTYKWIANPTVPHFTDTKVESGKTYFYKVTSMDVETNTHSEKSEAKGIVYTSTPDITTRKNIAAGVELSWEKITGATGYAIYRKSYSGTDAWVRIATIEGNDTFSWTDTSVKNNNGSEYRYTIRALGGADMKTLSGCRNTGRTMVRLSSQVLKSAVKADKTSIKCTWTTSKMVTGYEVRFMIGDQVYKTVTVGNYKTGVKTFAGLKAGEDYTIQVRTYKKVEGVGSFYSDWSAAKNVSL